MSLRRFMHRTKAIAFIAGASQRSCSVRRLDSGEESN